MSGECPRPRAADRCGGRAIAATSSRGGSRRGRPPTIRLRSPRGTCYWALSAPAAVIEVTSDPDQLDPPVLTLAALERLAVWQALDVPAARSKLADSTRAAVPGLTAELSTIVPDDIPWAWADALDADGRHGLLYVARVASMSPSRSSERREPRVRCPRRAAASGSTTRGAAERVPRGDRLRRGSRKPSSCARAVTARLRRARRAQLSGRAVRRDRGRRRRGRSRPPRA